MTESTVKVGVRIRPLLTKERHQNNCISNYDSQSIEFKNQTFTYDYVFGIDLPQQELYQNTAAPMLKSFLDGFNVTIIAYGQTGSGKTYTMGTAENDSKDPNSEGLIPRFVCDLFDNLENFSRNETLESNVKVSFLEIYGEDVFDLLGDTRSVDRTSLQVRESENGIAFVQNLQELVVTNSCEALNALTTGSKNRITASTNMNAGSSRSHAVFTITLNQTMRSSDSDEDTATHITSKLTFVDLAGSERIKRTGAEGQRMKEGIQINSGLFNLGQVINGLADDHRLKQGSKAVHIPYRNSKLTHLLKDALGGNSQTLFLACVSPAESNESETYSTLSYARQARNIKNKPVRNMDKQQLELKRLKYQVKAWMSKAIMNMIQSGQQWNVEDIDKTISTIQNHSDFGDILGTSGESDIFHRTDVQEYISTVNQKIDALVLGVSQPSPRKYRMSIISPRIRRSIGPTSRGYGLIQKKLQYNDENDNNNNHSNNELNLSENTQSNFHKINERSLSGISEDERMDEFQQINEDPEELVTRMIELVHKEKEMKETIDDDDNSSNSNSNKEEEEIEEVDREITEKEEILLKLKEAVKGFSVMKQEYEALLCDIHNLEVERNDLEAALEKAKKNQELLIQQKQPVNPAAMEKLQERFSKVKEELERMKSDKSRKENAYKVIQNETKKCETLSKEISKLKEMKVKLLQTQKSQNIIYQKYKKEQTQKLITLKKSDIKKQRLLNDLKSELQKKVRVLGNKDREIMRIQSKLKASEEHITQLLRIQNRGRQKLISNTSSTSTSTSTSSTITKNNGSNSNNFDEYNNLSSLDLGVLQSSKSILENMINEKVDLKYNKKLLTKKLLSLKEIKIELDENLSILKNYEQQRSQLEDFKLQHIEDFNDKQENDLLTLETQIKSMELTIEELTNEMNILNEDIADLTRQIGDTKDISESSWESITKGVINSLTLSQFQVIIWELLNSKAELLDNIRAEKEKYDELNELYETSQEKVNSLENQLNELKINMKINISNAEKQRVDDMWEILKNQPTTLDNNNSNGNGNNNNNTSVNNILLKRTQELETVLSDYMTIENDLKNEIYDLKYKNEELEKKLEKTLIQKHLETQIINTDNKRFELENQQKNDEIIKYYHELDLIWSKLGTSVNERESMLDMIDNANNVARNTIINKSKNEYNLLINKENEILFNYKQFIKVMQLNEDNYFNSEEYKDKTLIQRNLELESKYKQLFTEFESRRKKLLKVYEKLDKVIVELGYDLQSLSNELQILFSIDINMISCSNKPEDIVTYCLSKNLLISNSNFTIFDTKLRELTIECSNNISRITELIQSITPLRLRLGFKTIHDLSSLDKNTYDGNLNIKQHSLELLVNHKVKITGNIQNLNYLENLSFLLISLQTNRETCINNLLLFIEKIEQYFHISFNISEYEINNVLNNFTSSSSTSTTSLSSSPLNSNSNLNNTNSSSIDKINKEYILYIIIQLNQFPSLLDSYLDSSQLGLYALANDLGVTSEEYEPRMNLIANTPPQTNEELKIYSDLRYPMKILTDLLPYIDENWLSTGIQEIINLWNERSNDTNFAIVLLSEKHRMAKYSEALQEIIKYDETLSKHITEMELFELTSKQNRQKVLMGNSKALVEEEKFRKAGKRRFEQISEKLLEAARTSQLYSHGFPLDISKLSQHGQDLLKGKISERIELMHLHTMTHGTKRWSGDTESNHSNQGYDGGNINGENNNNYNTNNNNNYNNNNNNNIENNYIPNQNDMFPNNPSTSKKSINKKSSIKKDLNRINQVIK